MPKRLESFRVGDRREAIALAYLRCLGFIAPVPRDEDIGLDAVVTLSELRQGVNYPMETFGVQIKPTSCDALYFGEEHDAWFNSLVFPLFFVTRDKGKMHFFSTFRLLHYRPKYPKFFEPAWLVFHEDPEGDEGIGLFDGYRRYGMKVPGRRSRPKRGQVDPQLSIPLGDPIVSLDECALEESLDYRSSMVDILRRHIQLGNKARMLRQFDVIHLLRWRTNCIPELHYAGYSAGPIRNLPDDQIEMLLASLCLLELSMDIEDRKLTSGNAVPAHMAGLAEIVSWLRSRGVVPDDNDLGAILRRKGLGSDTHD